MSRRRRRVKIRSSSVELFAIVFNLLLLINSISAAQASPSIVYGLCKTLPANISRQLKLCRFVSYSTQADEAVANGASRGLAECRNQFRSERWNCTHAAGDHHLLTSKLTQSVGNRESGFLQAILAAGIVHSISTACSTGSLNDCACDKSRIGTFRQRDQTWKWGGCSSNIRHGLFYARHLVDLLDAVHEYHNQQQQQQHNQMQRSLSGNNQHHRQTRRHHQHHHHHQHNQEHQHLVEKRSVVPLDQQQESNFCLAHNISQTSHIQLVKSLLAKNSLERHPNFRLAMNAHNNRVGRQTVSKQMVRKCRCHGLSGSCSLRTCWMELNEFKEIGKELKRKYEASIHLPTAINVNRLIPMMDRNEISIILQQQHEQQAQMPESSIIPPPSTPTSELSPNSNDNTNNLKVATTPDLASLQPEAWTSESASPPARLNFYERHKQLEQRLAAPSLVTTSVPVGHAPTPTTHNHKSNTTSLFIHGDEAPVHITPMSHLQYQALLRDLKLCHGNASSSPVASTTLTRSSHLSTRDLHQFDFQAQHQQVPLASQRHQLGRKSIATNSNEIGATKLGPNSNHKHATSAQSQPFQLQSPPPQVQAQLSQLLQASNRDELVYLHKSPDYCEPDLRHGYAGVKSRQCSKEPHASDSCDRLCCGRGFERREIELRYNCDCKFQYCCEIHCNVCQKVLVEFVCK